jgi:predicted heme/steroid binding protein
MFRYKSTKFKVVLIIIVAFLLVDAIGLYIIFRPSHQTPIQANLKTYTAAELKKYDGSDPSLPIYLAMDSYVYDITKGKTYYQPGGAYHSLAGKDSSVELHFAGGGIISSKYPIIGKLVK